MTPVFRARVDARLERIEHACADLERAANRPGSAWSADRDLQDATQRRLEVAAQAVIDVASHLIAERGWRTPGTYRDAFTELEARGVLNSDLVESMRQAAGLRNVLAHDYMDVDVERLFLGLSDEVRALRAYVAAVLRYLGPIGAIPE